MRINSGSGVRRIGHDSKVGCVLMTDRKDFIPIDRSAFSQKMTNVGSTWQMDGRKYDGVDDYIDVGDPTNFNLKAHIMSAWIYITDYTLYPQIISSLNGNDQLYLRVWNDGSLSAGYGDGTNFYENRVGMVPLNTWVFVASTINEAGTQRYVYINDSQYALQIYTAPNMNVTKLKIGYELASLRYFNGSIDEVRIYNRAEYTAKISRQTFRRKAGIGGA